MPALGQKLPRRGQIVMSALPPKGAASLGRASHLAVSDRPGCWPALCGRM